MIARKLIATLTLFVVAGGIVVSPQTAEAGNDVLIELLGVLRDNGTISEDAYRALHEAAQAEQSAAAPHAASNAATTNGAAPGSASTDDAVALPSVSVGGGGLAVESADGEYAFEVGGRLHVDHAWYDDGDGIELGDGGEIRRIRLELGGTFARDWDYSMGVEFAGNEVALRSTYLRYNGLDPATILIGNYKEPFSLERLNSSNSVTFMERAAATTAFAPGRNIGLGATTHGDIWALAAGVFSEGLRDSEDEVDTGWGVTGRAMFVPVREKTRLLHLGAAYSHRRPGDNDEVRYRERPESHVTSLRLVNTGNLADVDAIDRYGLEAASVWGPLSVQAEYYRADNDRSGGGSARFDGWYAYASWFLTGESRRYRFGRGTFGTVRPQRDAGRGGWGAWEVAARYSNLDLNDGSVVGGEQDTSTVGLNWYVNRNLRFMANYVSVLNLDRPGDALDGVEPDIFQVRSQLNF